jgi:D-alanine-D-alanine ligase
MTLVKVAVIGGGPGCEREISLASAAAVAEGLAEAGYEVEHLTIDRTGGWRDAAGNTLELAEAVRVLCACAVVVPTVQGPRGADGTLAALCDLAGVPWVGSPLRAAALAMDTWATNLVAEAVGVRTARGTLVAPDAARHLAGMLAADLPMVVRSAEAGSSGGASVARTEEELVAALEVAFALDDRVLVEEVVHGREIDVAVLGRPDGTRMVAAALETLTSEEARQLEEAAITMYDGLGCAGVARLEFVLAGDGPVLSQVNAMPALTRQSEVPRMFAAAGISYPALLDLLVSDALRTARVPVAAR